MDVTLAHDYLVQFGGAERVVATWADQLPESRIYSIAYLQDETFSAFRSHEVATSIRSPRLAANIPPLLPLLPRFARSVEVDQGDVALVSSSGWAHQFTYSMPTLMYVHSPARWLYAADDYRLRLGRVARAGLRASSGFLKHRDQAAIREMSRIVVNSRVSQERVRAAYSIDAEIIHPPVAAAVVPASRPKQTPKRPKALVVSRNRGYKNVDLAIRASLEAGLACVVVGGGSEEFDSQSEGVFGMGRVSDGELRWLYGGAAVVVGSAHEDFGLTILESNLEGTPAACVPFGGYLETVKHGINGVLAHDESSSALARAIQDAQEISPLSCISWAEQFSPEQHLQKLIRHMEDLV